MAVATAKSISPTVSRSTLAPEVKVFLEDHPQLHLGGADDFHAERRHHLEVFGIHNIPESKIHTIDEVAFTGLQGPHGTIPIRIMYPSSATKGTCGAAALIYFHGGGYTVGLSSGEFENGLRLLAEESGVQIYAVEYKLAPEFGYPTQLDEYSAVIDALQSSSFGSSRGVDPQLVFGGGDSAGGNMTAAITLRRHDEGKQNLAGQMLFYPEARLPFDTPAATENNTGFYLESNGIFSFADHYLPRGIPPAHRYISPGMQKVADLHGLPPARVFTAGFDPLRDVGHEYALKLKDAGNDVQATHFDRLTHGFLQMTAWSDECVDAVKIAASQLKEMTQQGKT